ncbi:MAG: 50S ribosomal protein L32 [bacterium]
MANPKRRFSHSRTAKRKARWLALNWGGLSICPHCHSLKQAHRVCPSCGYYKGNLVVEEVKKK